jgi:hypothetical protein
MVAPKISGSEVWNLLHVILLTPRVLRWLLEFLEVFATLRLFQSSNEVIFRIECMTVNG